MRQLFSLFIPSLRQPQECEACHQAFTCDASLTGCWCMEIKLDDQTRKALRARYQRCLCRRCLESAQAGTLPLSGD